MNERVRPIAPELRARAASFDAAVYESVLARRLHDARVRTGRGHSNVSSTHIG